MWFHDGGTLGYLSKMFWLKCNDVVVMTVINHGSKEAETGSDVLRDDLVAYLQELPLSKKCNISI